MRTTASRKSDIQDWLRSKTIQFEGISLEVELLAILDGRKKYLINTIINETAKAQNKIVLWLPFYSH